MAVGKMFNSINEGIEVLTKNLQWNGKPILGSNAPINKIGKFVLGESNTGFRGVAKGLSDNEGFTKAVKNAYTTEKGLNYKAIAGSYVGAAAAGRVLSGGGIYRDSTGNTNLPVVPFI